MVTRHRIGSQELFRCEECGLDYEKEAQAEACEAYCTAKNACSLVITQDAVYRGEEAEIEGCACGPDVA